MIHSVPSVLKVHLKKKVFFKVDQIIYRKKKNTDSSSEI